jgi:uncharacterized protein YwbE
MSPARSPIRSKALVLYDGTRTPHRSCGIALAETFDRPSAAYQSLRRGGITGRGTCGAVVAGQLILGEFLGDPDPTGKVTPALRTAMLEYDDRIAADLTRGASPDLVCNNLTAPHGDFMGPARHHFCTALVGQVAGIVDAILRAHGTPHRATAVQLSDGSVFDPEAVPSDSSTTAPESPARPGRV